MWYNQHKNVSERTVFWETAKITFYARSLEWKGGGGGRNIFKKVFAKLFREEAGNALSSIVARKLLYYSL